MISHCFLCSNPLICISEIMKYIHSICTHHIILNKEYHAYPIIIIEYSYIHKITVIKIIEAHMSYAHIREEDGDESRDISKVYPYSNYFIDIKRLYFHENDYFIPDIYVINLGSIDSKHLKDENSIHSFNQKHIELIKYLKKYIKCKILCVCTTIYTNVYPNIVFHYKTQRN